MTTSLTSSLHLRAIGWKPFFEQQLSLDHSRASIVARVSAHHGSQIILLGAQGEFSIPTQLAGSIDEIAVGDWLVLDAADHRALDRLRRQTLLARKASGEEVKSQVIAANIDTIFIVCSCNEDFNLSRIERYLALTLQSGATPVVVLTKADLTATPAVLRRQVEQLHTGLLVESGELDERRFSSFKKLLAEQAHNSRSLADRRDHDRKTGKLYKSIISHKRRRRDEA